MTNELYKLEAAILNLQEPYEKISSRYEKAKGEYYSELKQRLAEIPGLMGASIMEGSLLELIGNSAAILTTAGDESTQIKVGETLQELNEKYGSKVRELYNKKYKIETELAGHNSKLATFTVLSPVQETTKPEHIHIYVVQAEKAYHGEIDFRKGHLMLTRNEYSISQLEELKEKNKCPMYIATHPSRVASPPIIFCGAVHQLLEKVGHEFADVMKRKIDQAMHGSMN